MYDKSSACHSFVGRFESLCCFNRSRILRLAFICSNVVLAGLQILFSLLREFGLPEDIHCRRLSVFLFPLRLTQRGSIVEHMLWPTFSTCSVTILDELRVGSSLS